MKKLIFMVVVVLTSLSVHAKDADLPKGMSKKEYDEYIAGCKKMILEAQPGKDAKEVDMLCSDPYLKGKANESREDKARRLRLLDETNAAKAKAMEKFVTPPKATDGMSPTDQAQYIKDCKKMLLEADPGKDPADADMLCRDPYLKGKPNESRDDEVRRKRLMKETDDQKARMLDKHVKPVAPSKDSKSSR